jgi:hypothetical protein
MSHNAVEPAGTIKDGLRTVSAPILGATSHLLASLESSLAALLFHLAKQPEAD